MEKCPEARPCSIRAGIVIFEFLASLLQFCINTMGNKQLSSFEKLVLAIYGFYILLSSVWITMNLVFGHYFNYQAFIVAAVFAVQAYYRHKLANLLLGILLLAVSIYAGLEFMLMGGKTGFDAFVNIMIGICIASVIMSGILIFSYTKLSFAE